MLKQGDAWAGKKNCYCESTLSAWFQFLGRWCLFNIIQVQCYISLLHGKIVCVFQYDQTSFVNWIISHYKSIASFIPQGSLVQILRKKFNTDLTQQTWLYILYSFWECRKFFPEGSSSTSFLNVPAVQQSEHMNGLYVVEQREHVCRSSSSVICATSIDLLAWTARRGDSAEIFGIFGIPIIKLIFHTCA